MSAFKYFFAGLLFVWLASIFQYMFVTQNVVMLRESWVPIHERVLKFTNADYPCILNYHNCTASFLPFDVLFTQSCKDVLKQYHSCTVYKELVNDSNMLCVDIREKTKFGYNLSWCNITAGNCTIARYEYGYNIIDLVNKGIYQIPSRDKYLQYPAGQVSSNNFVPETRYYNKYTINRHTQISDMLTVSDYNSKLAQTEARCFGLCKVIDYLFIRLTYRS